MIYFQFRKEKAEKFTLDCMQYAIKWIEENTKHKYIDSHHYRSDSRKLEDLVKLSKIEFIHLYFTDDLTIKFTKDCGIINMFKTNLQHKRFNNLNEKTLEFLNKI